MVVSIHAQDSKTGERRHHRVCEMKRLSADITEFEHSFSSETEIITRCETLSPQHLRECSSFSAAAHSREYRCCLGGALVIATTRSAGETCTTGCAPAYVGTEPCATTKSDAWREP